MYKTEKGKTLSCTDLSKLEKLYKQKARTFPNAEGCVIYYQDGTKDYVTKQTLQAWRKRIDSQNPQKPGNG